MRKQGNNMQTITITAEDQLGMMAFIAECNGSTNYESIVADMMSAFSKDKKYKYYDIEYEEIFPQEVEDFILWLEDTE